MTKVQLFIGGLTRIDDEGQATGIYKHPVDGPIRLGTQGLAGDQQADRRVHGGPEKAIHHYPAEHYAHLASRFPALSGQLLPGSIGENLSTTGWDEHSVCIGDIFQLGEARLQVSQPRSPCWKIDHRYGATGVAGFIAETGCTGWYYRVLESATVAPDSRFALLERLPGAVPLAEFWQLWCEHRPDPAALEHISAAPGLTPAWRKKLAARVDWLRANNASAPGTVFHVKQDASADD